MAAPVPAPADPHASHRMPAPAAETPAADPHAGHQMPAAAPAPMTAPPPPEAYEGPEHAAEIIYDPALFRQKRQKELIDMHGGFATSMILVDQLEYRARDGRDGYKWDAQGWYGGDYNKIWLKSEGEGTFGAAPEQAEVQALYARALDPWFSLQAGVRQDFGEGPDRTHLVLGIEGLAPYWFEAGASLFLSNKGELTARAETEYDLRITNRLILQPAVEFNLSAQDVPALRLGSGLSSAEVGLRVRYQFAPEFAPYLGVEYERKFGGTARFARAAGEDAGGWNLVAGVRFWF